MFNCCHSLQSIDLTSFDISSVTKFGHMFYDCFSLISINLTHFKTDLVCDIDYMFYNNQELTSIDLSNFNTQNMTEMDHIFYNCKKLEYINLKNFEETKNPTRTDMFYNIPKNVVICLYSGKSPNIYNLANKIIYVTFSCNADWKSDQKNLTIYRYEYQGKCINYCPLNTYTYNNKCYSCDSNCKTCSFDENILINSNFTSCEPNKYLYMGNCIDNCINGYYEDDNDSSIKICKCVKIKCKICSTESLNKNLCISCNDGFYPMLNDESNKGNFINCYNGSLDYYYLDINNKIYKPCYYKCKTCDKNGDDNNHNCLECKSEYGLKKLINGYYNCYSKCDNHYYFDKYRNYVCLGVKKCPNDYNKLIPQLGKYIDNCSKDSDYPYEFTKTCYSQCPNDEFVKSYESKNKNKFCEVNCTKEFPFEIKEYQNCTDYCGINDINDKVCISKYGDEETNANLIMGNIHKDIVSINFRRDILYYNDKNIIIEEVYTTFTIKTNKMQKNNVNQIVNFGKCEKIFKSFYDLKNTDNLVILIISIKKRL